MGDVQIRHVELVGQLEHQIHDRDPDAHVEHRGRLVGHDEVRVEHQGPGDRHTLTLTTGELVRVTEQESLGRGQAHEPEHLGHPTFAFADRSDLLHHQGLGHRVVDRPARVHRLVGILEDHLHVATKLPHVLRSDMGYVEELTLVVGHEDLTAGRLHQLDEHSTGGALPAAGLPHQAEAFAPCYLETDSVDCVDEIDRLAKHPSRDREQLRKLIDLDQRGRHLISPPISGTFCQWKHAT